MAAGNFPACVPVTFGYEGGLSVRRDDPGNWTGGRVGSGELKGTNFGIAASSYPTLDIEHLTRVEAETIYQRDFWIPSGCEALPTGLDLSHFDGTVNSGRGRSAKWLRAAGNGAPVDRIHAYNSARLAFDEALRTWATFGKGWGPRVANVEAKSVRMALGDSPAATAAIHSKAVTHANKAKSARAHRNAVATAGPVAAGGTVAAHGHAGFVIAVLLIGIAAAGFIAFVAWRNQLRADALAAEAAKPSLPASKT